VLRRSDRYRLDADRLATLWEELAGPMAVYYTRRVLDAEVAVDLVAETFAQAFADRDQFRGSTREEAAGWLYGIARHQLSRYFKRGAAARRALQRLNLERPNLSSGEIEELERLAELRSLQPMIAQAMTHLSPDQRHAVQLRVVGEQTYADVAMALGVSEQTARARVSRGLRSLGEELGPALDARAREAA
jgi:RNA polymerase sigma factor (sigma-70 family)